MGNLFCRSITQTETSWATDPYIAKLVWLFREDVHGRARLHPKPFAINIDFSHTLEKEVILLIMAVEVALAAALADSYKRLR